MNKDRKPNVIFYFSDQQRADTCGCYGQKLPTTPCLDEMAKEGTVFENAFSPQPVCGPCRAIFQTGQYATEIGCFRNNKMLPLNAKTVANYVEGAGYETAYIGKWHLASEGDMDAKLQEVDYTVTAIPPEYRGGYTGFWRTADILEFTSDSRGGFVFDEDMNKIEFSGYRCDSITDFALEYLDKYDGEKPFFMTVSHIEPHHQNTHHHYEGPEGSKERWKDFDAPEDLKRIGGGDWEEEYPDYLGAIHSVDENLGRIIKKLKEKGLYDNTVIIFSSDHGSHFKTRNRDEHRWGGDDYKRSCHDSAIKVPLVITGGPFRQGGKRVSEIVSTGSIPKTIVDLTGTDVDKFMIGENLADLAEGRIADDRKDEAFIQISESRCARAIRTHKYMYSCVAPGSDGGRIPSSTVYIDDFLYDLEKDPYELNNLIHDESYTEIKKELRAELLSWIKEAEHMDAEIIER